MNRDRLTAVAEAAIAIHEELVRLGRSPRVGKIRTADTETGIRVAVTMTEDEGDRAEVRRVVEDVASRFGVDIKLGFLVE